MSNLLSKILVYVTRARARVKREFLRWVGISPANVIQIIESEYIPKILFAKIAEIAPSEFIQIENPRSLQIEAHSFCARYLLRIDSSSTVVDARTGLVFSGKQIVAESSAWPHLWLAMNSIPHPILPQEILLGENEDTILLPSNSFYHSLIEDVPKFLSQISILENATILISESANTWIRELVTLFPNQVLEVPRYYKTKKHFFISSGGDTGWPHPHDIALLRNKLLPAILKTPEVCVYVSRTRSSRSPVFESKLCELLEGLGWKVAYMENLTLIDQIALFSSARVVAGVHGAGLAGIVWMQSGCKVIELGPDRFVPCYARLARLVALDYLRVEFQDELGSLDSVLAAIAKFSKSCH